MSVDLKLETIKRKILSKEITKSAQLVGSLRDREITEYLNKKYPDKTSVDAFVIEKFGEGYNIKQHFENPPKSGSGVSLSNQSNEPMYIVNPDLNRSYDAIRCKDYRGDDVIVITYVEHGTLFCSIKRASNATFVNLNGKCPLSILKQFNLEPILT